MSYMEKSWAMNNFKCGDVNFGYEIWTRRNVLFHDDTYKPLKLRKDFFLAIDGAIKNYN